MNNQTLIRISILFTTTMVIYPMEHKLSTGIPSLKELSFSTVVSNMSTLLSSTNGENLKDNHQTLKKYVAKLPLNIGNDVTRLLCKGFGWYLYPWKTVIIKCKSKAYGITALSFSSHGLQLASAAGGKEVSIWDLCQLKCIKNLELAGPVIKVSFLSKNSNSLLILHHHNNSVNMALDLFNLKSNSTLKTISFPDEVEFLSHYETLSFSRTGHSMAQANGSDIIISKTDNASLGPFRNHFNLQDHHIEGNDNWSECTNFPEDMTLVPFGTELKAASTWYIAQAKFHEALSGHRNAVLATAYEDKTNYLASVSCDNTMRIWNLQKNARVASIMFNSRPQSIVFSPDGLSLANGCENGNIYVFSCQDTLLHLICKAAMTKELKKNNKNALKKLWDHILINKCDPTLKQNIKSMINKQTTNDNKDVDFCWCN